MIEAIDYSTLRWVKQELDETLKQARQALEAYVEAPEDQAQMSFCAAHLHQVYGTLQMVELYGASLLSEEMEQVAKALLAGTIRQQDDAYSVLMGAMLQLPDYLERLMQGGRDIPLVLLPLLNDLRAVRGENLLSENAMFSPNLDSPMPDQIRQETVADLAQVAKTQRHQYQIGLLAWYREQNTQDGLAKIGAVLQSLQEGSATPASARLWWLAGGLVDALQEGVLEVSLSTKLLLGQIDRQIKQLIDLGEETFAAQAPVDLQKNLLFYIGRASGGGERIRTIKDTYKLDLLLPEAEELESARESITGHNQDLLNTVSIAIKENLAQIKDGLDGYQRSGYEQLDLLQPVAETLKSLGDTLGMLGMGAPRMAIMEKVAVTHEILAGERSPTEAEMMDIASALLSVEKALDGAVAGRKTEAATPEDAEFDQVMVVVLKEAIVDMSRAKEALTKFMEEGDHGVLKDVPQLFNQVKGGLLLLGREKAAALIDSVAKYIFRDVLAKQAMPTEEKLNAMADAVCGVEYYLEGQKERRLFGAAVIDVAVASVAKLGYPLPTSLADNAGLEPIALIDEVPADETADSLTQAGGEVAEWEDEVGEIEALVAATPKASPPAKVSSGLPVIGEDVDEEILEIFIEEAEEELATIRTLLPQWLNNIEDEEALTTMRRSFHTLKGSGRLVGATFIGEFSWAFEGLLNRVLEKTLQLNEDMRQVLQQAPPALHELIEQVKGNGAPEIDYALLQAQAEALARGDSLGSVQVSKEEKEEIVPVPREEDFVPALLSADDDLSMEPEAAPIAVMDPVLYEIFYAETDTHLQSVYAFIAACNNHVEDCVVNEALIRALHTLHGSARMAEAKEIADIGSELERYSKLLLAEQMAMPAEGLSALQEGAEHIQEIMDLLKHEASELPDIQPLLLRVKGLQEAVLHLAQLDTEKASHAADAGQPEAAEDAGEEIVAQQPVAVNTPSVYAVIGDGVDPDIFDVFVEEAEEELASVHKNLPQWLANVEDKEALITVRRSFHTLKGSGRMVGAMAIGEFSWSIESLLNRLLDGVVAPNDTVFAVLRDVSDCLPQLVQQVISGAAPEMDPLAIMARADAITAGAQEMPETVDESVAAIPEEITLETIPAPIEEVAEVPAMVVAENPYADVDPELLEIFLEEADEILESGDATLQKWVESPKDADLMAEYLRQLHTLKGGARMAEISAIGDLSHGVETMLEAVVEGEAPVSKRMLDLLQMAQDRLASMVEKVRAQVVVEPAEGLIAELESLLHDTGETAALQHIHLQSEAVEQAQEETASVEHNAVTTAAFYADADPELLEIFLEEGDEILQASEATLHRWSEAPDNFNLMAQFQRELHTLKGGARMANIPAIGDLSHGIEALVTVFSDTKKIPPKQVFDALNVAQDRLVSMVEHVRKQKPIEAADGLLAELQALIPGAKVIKLDAQQKARQLAEAQQEDQDRRMGVRSPQQELVRVRADLLDNLVNYAGEISIYRSRLEQQNGAYRFNLTEMEATITRLRQQLRQLEMETEAQILSNYQDEADQYGIDYDPLEMDRYSTLQQLSRSLAESVGDLSSIQILLDNITRESETLLLQQSRVNTELQEGLMRTRMVPFIGLAPRMRRIVRQTCQTLGKQAELHLDGAEGEMDRTVIDRIIAPLEHMLRNAISHGIEAPSQRLAAGKPEIGSMRVSLSREASEVVVRIEDDGAGINLKNVRNKAIERGLMRKDSTLTDDEILQFILESGFSTAKEVTQVSGRGVGMDVVSSEVKQLGGSLHIASTLGKGTCFTVRLPFTLAINHALLISAGEERYAIPLSSIEGIVRLRREDLLKLYNDPTARYEYGGYKYELQHLGSLLGVSAPNLDALANRVPVLLARSGEHCVALHVDELMGSREIVVKSVGAQISTVPGVSGATILGDGSVVLILELAPLVRMGSLDQMLRLVEPAEPEKASEAITVMVVDDSITVRKVTTRLLERNGFNVVAAKDGVDALAKLQEFLPDVMLLDIEMPRMDGFEVATHVRNDTRLHDTPIIMITSRTGDKHRNRAMEIGVNRYLGKPFVESELLENIQAMLVEKGKHG